MGQFTCPLRHHKMRPQECDSALLCITPLHLGNLNRWSPGRGRAPSCADNGDRIAGSALSFVTTTRQNITSSTCMANIELFSCVVPVNNQQRTYTAQMNTLISDCDAKYLFTQRHTTVAERKIRVLSMCGACLSATNI
jgi:hypothetical protein